MRPDVGKVAALIGDPVRSSMLFSLLDGGELSASELARRAGASAQAASAHLGKLVEGRLLTVRNEGRRRLFRLASSEIARAIELLAAIASVPEVRSLNQYSLMKRLRRARTCYDHLAGKLGVGITESLQRKRIISARGDLFELTSKGERFFRDLDIDLDAARNRHRSFSRACLDWTERRHHLAGALGAAMLERLLEEKWLLRNRADRSLTISDEGLKQFESMFGVSLTE